MLLSLSETLKSTDRLSLRLRNSAYYLLWFGYVTRVTTKKTTLNQAVDVSLDKHVTSASRAVLESPSSHFTPPPPTQLRAEHM